MKSLILTVALLSPLVMKAQNLKEYKATNGVTYHVGDTVKLGKGSNGNGSFLYIEDRGFGLPGPPGRTTGRGLPKDFANSGVVIKSIRKSQISGLSKTQFMVSGVGPFRLSLLIDDAISACEVLPCQTAQSTGPVASVADEIKKLKDLLDAGALTKEEYELRKKKLLDQ